jgi:hypothetical protein
LVGGGYDPRIDVQAGLQFIPGNIIQRDVVDAMDLQKNIQEQLHGVSQHTVNIKPDLLWIYHCYLPIDWIGLSIVVMRPGGISF